MTEDLLLIPVYRELRSQKDAETYERLMAAAQARLDKYTRRERAERRQTERKEQSPRVG